jgi:hypothetical protein
MLQREVPRRLDHATTESRPLDGGRHPNAKDMQMRREVRFKDDGGDELSAWLYLPDDGEAPRPAISMAHVSRLPAGTAWPGSPRRLSPPASSCSCTITARLASAPASRAKI